MKFDSIVSAFKDTIPALCKKHAPAILTGVGVAGFVFTTVEAVRRTPRAIEKIEERKLDLEVEKLGPVETVKAAGTMYILPAITGTVSIACILSSHKISASRSAALATAYALSETAFKDYKDKVIETFGEKKEEKVKEGVLQDKITNNPPDPNTIIATGHGSTLCYDSFCGRYFYSDPEYIKSVFNEVNRQLLFDNSVSMNDFYAKLGLEETEAGDILGWGLGKTGGLIEVYLSAKLDSADHPVLVMEFVNHPVVDYSQWL